jgi:hypothetical protein
LPSPNFVLRDIRLRHLVVDDLGQPRRGGVMIYILIVLSGVYSAATTARVASYANEQQCQEAGESYVKQAAEAYPHDRFHFVCVPGFEGE